MARRTKQMSFFEPSERAYGGILLKKRKARQEGRPLSTKHTMHLVLRSTMALGQYSFLSPKNSSAIQRVLKKFALKYFVELKSVANVGNHIHIHLKLNKRVTYDPFIRAITSAIAMAVAKPNRLQSLKEKGIKKFWDYRPFTRIIIGKRAYLILRDYLKINELEGQGFNRSTAQAFVWQSRGRWSSA